MLTRIELCALLALSLLIPLTASSAVITYNDAWGEAGFNLVSQSVSGVEVVFSITEMDISDFEVDGQIMQVVSLPGVFLPNDAGAPNLPGTGHYVAIPKGAGAKLTVVDYRTEVFKGLDIIPAFAIPKETDKGPLTYVKNPDIYNRNANYPDHPVKISAPDDIRGVDVMMLGITPFQYNPVTKDLIVYRDLRVRVDFIGGNGHFGEDRLRSRYFEPILRGNIMNYASLPEVNFNHIPISDEDNVEYVIIIPDDPAFEMWADSIKIWRNQQGIITGITHLSEIGGNDATLIENYINNAYNTWEIPPVAVLLLSDYQNSGELYGITSPVWNSYCVSDNIYADVNGNNLPDIIFARITAHGYNDLQEMVEKFLSYERTPPTDPNFYYQPLIAGGWQSDRWFILCTEIIYGFMENVLDKRPVRQYAGATGPPSQWSTNPNTYMIVNYFGPSGLGYIPASPSYLTNWSGNATGINNAINNGAFFTLHRDHGEITGWSTPSYHIENLSGLNNDELTFVFSLNCLTGKYDNSTPCFCEAFHRMEHGALGIIGASQVSYSFVNDTYCWGMFDSMWPEFDPYQQIPGGVDLQPLRPAFANAYGKYYLAASSWPSNPGNKVHTYHLFHHHGDAFITLYSEVPENLTVSHPLALLGGASSFTVTANEGSLIALTVNNQIIGVGEGTGAPLSIPITPQVPGTTMLVTITLQNYYRYMQPVPVVPPEGPYVIFNNLTINDASGNNNGMLDFGEDVLLNVTLENIGVAVASDVSATITTEDAYTTIVQDSAYYGDIPANTTMTLNDAFDIAVAQNVPDQHNITFTLHAFCGDSVWNSNFVITAHAPLIEFDHLVIQDSTGNLNNQLDPGETANFYVFMKNNGTCDASNVQMILDTDEPLITIPTNIAVVDALNAGAMAAFTYNDIVADPTMPMGTNVEFGLDITANGGYANEDGFGIVVGDIRYLPTGPDAYGYWAYDMYDGVGAPTYNWMEIAPSAGGPGTPVTLGDDQTIVINLPFNFRYYGLTYNQASICSNGWLGIGSQTSTAYTNTNIPNSAVPNNTIFALWDDLYPPGGGQISYYYDATNHRFIVEWYQIPHYGGGGGPETFQVMLYDPSFYFTATGDGNVQVNYNTIAAVSSVSCGIENSGGTIGLQYLYNGVYDSHAMPLQNAFAIKYTTGTGIAPSVQITLEPQGTPIVIPPGGGTFNYNLTVTNTGNTTAYFSGWTEATLPDSSLYGPILLRTGLALSPGGAMFRAMTQTVPATAPAGDYTYWGRLGSYPGFVLSEDSFPFSKSGVDASGLKTYSDWTITGWEGEGLAVLTNIPTEFFLSQNYPNPFNPVTTINYSLPADLTVDLSVYNILGQKILTLVEGKESAGYHSITWDASNLPSGIYFYHLNAGEYSQIRKCVLMK